MNNTSTRTEILESLNNVAEMTMESESNVICSLLGQADKAVYIMENYRGPVSDLEFFAIYQEADQNSADGEKKENIFVKLWNFIKNIFGNLGNYIKQCWNGKVVPTATKATEETKGFFNKIFKKIFDKEDPVKEPSWFEKNAETLGLSVAGVSLAIQIFAFINRDKIATALNNFFGKIKNYFSDTSDAIKIASLEFTDSGVKTNIKFEAIKKVLLGGSDFIKAVRSMKSNDPNSVKNVISKCEEIERLSKVSFIDEHGEFDEIMYSTVIDGVLDPIKKTFTDNNFTFGDENIDVKPDNGNPSSGGINDDQNANKIKKSCTIVGVFFAAVSGLVSKVWDWVTGIFGFTKKANDTNTSSNGDNSASDNAASDINAADTTQPTPGEPATDGESPEPAAEETATEPELNGQYDPAQVEGWVTNINDKNGDRKSVIPYNGHRFQWSKDANKYVYVESAEEDIDVDDSVVSEAATWYNRF